MRKLSLFISCLVIVFYACKKTDGVAVETKPLAIDKRKCASDSLLQAQIAADPSLAQRLQHIEEFTQRALASGDIQRTMTGAMEIPVVVHVLYNKPEENISDLQISSQIDVLNEDYNLQNRDATQIPSIFTDRKANVGVSFRLAQTIRKFTTATSFPANDNMKYSSKGGDDAIDPAHKLNIWVCNLGDGLLGYSTFPGSGSAKADGVVVGYFCFGRKGTLIAKYDEGRTATHEVGHWLNLRHIWGDRTCGDDRVGDTPQATTANYNCPAFPHYNSCTSHEVEMTMNYMDYTQDACMYMFTNGQKSRMLAVFLSGGPRAGFFQ